MAVHEITIDQLADRLTDPTVRLIDVREPDEFAQGRVPGAVSIPLSTVPAHLDELRGGDGDLFVICQAGGRSLHACGYLSDNGVDAVNVAGGTGAWVMAGRETASGAM